jgi:hypothetical protein
MSEKSEGLSGNIGEWSEIYTLFKIIADKKLYGGTSELHKVESMIFPIIKILRDESNGTFEFSYDNDLVVVKNKNEEFRISVKTFYQNASFLLNKLKEKNKSSFTIPEIETFINSYGSKSIKAKSSLKSDIRIIIHDLVTGRSPQLGFSIKSEVGTPPTLFNSNKSTNFAYKIVGDLSPTDLEEINRIVKYKGTKVIQDVKGRLRTILNKGCELKFSHVPCVIFHNNLTLVDSSLPNILAHALYKYFTSGISKSIEIINSLASENPLKFNFSNDHPFYSYKFKRFLTDVSLGMLPTKVWGGIIDATGGYLVVKKDGEVLCYHIYNRNEFEDYLYVNTKFDTPSATKHDFGYIYQLNGELYINLNFQIRFI